jgi:hypothetical protein
MRDKTFTHQDWVRKSLDLTQGWLRLFVRPPDFLTVLQKRCNEWRQKSDDIGGVGFREAMEVTKWVSQMFTVQKSIEKVTEHELLDIIQHRYPFNLREQLRKFTSCCENVFLHREWLRSRDKRKEKGGIAWPDKSYEFFLRVFLLGSSRFFNEALCDLPNIYDNDFPKSTFNACIRPWILGRIVRDESFDKGEVIDFFVGIGLPQSELDYAIESLEKYDLIYSLEKNQKVLSIWGEYFRREIAYDLPYISTVWWTTYMSEPYSLGDAHEIQATELREASGKFLRWLHTEELFARSRLTMINTKLFEIFVEASSKVSWSLHNIEKSIDMSRSRHGGQND